MKLEQLCLFVCVAELIYLAYICGSRLIGG